MRAITIPSSLVVISLLGACAQPAPERAYVNTTAEAAGDNVDEAIDYAWSVIELDAERGVEDIEVHSVEIDAMGITHVRMQQLKDGLPVRGAEAIVHIPPASAMTLTDHFVDDNTDYTEPVIGSEEAERIALDSAGAGGEVETSSLAWMVRGEGGLRLVYEVAIDRIAAAASAPVVSVDARTGELLGQRERVHNHSYQASAEGVHAGEVTVNAVELEGTSYLVDLDARVAALDCHGLDSRSCEVAYSQTDDFNQALHGQTVDALVGVTSTLDFFASLGRDGIDGNGGPTSYAMPSEEEQGWQQEALRVRANFRSGRAYGDMTYNAFWTGEGIYVGSGDDYYTTSWGTRDILAHEVTHGVVQFTAGLNYSDESGALNESYADIFGAMVELAVEGEGSQWLIGEDLLLPASGMRFLRDMSDPTADGVSSDHYEARYTGREDNGGVHWNSGIQNLAFYLLVEGGEHPSRSDYGAMSGIGATDGTWIAFESLNYLTSTSDFADARDAWEAAAAARFGEDSDQLRAVQGAWDRVGVI